MTKLELALRHQELPALASLKYCTNIASLHLKFPAAPELAPPAQDLINELAAWLADCGKLKEITLEELKSAPALLTPMLLNNEIRLDLLGIDARVNQYSIKDNSIFHRAIASQPNLRSLSLQGESEDAFSDDRDVLVDVVGALTNLRKLHLRGVADEFCDDDLARMLAPLKYLVDLYTGGWNITDDVLNTVSGLHNLRVLNLVAVTSFTAAGLLDFMAKLGSGNEGLHMSVDNADPVALIPDEELAMIRDVFREKVSGRLDYMPFRGRWYPEQQCICSNNFRSRHVRVRRRIRLKYHHLSDRWSNISRVLSPELARRHTGEMLVRYRYRHYVSVSDRQTLPGIGSDDIELHAGQTFGIRPSTWFAVLSHIRLIFE